MNEIDQIWLKYENQSLIDGLESLDDVNRLALAFGEDVAHTYRLITLRSNPSRCLSGYDLADAPIVGLLTRIAKLLRLICKFYELGNGDHLTLFSRPLIESAIIATYLLREGDEAVEDFRKCSYKHTLRILRDHESGSEFFRTPAGQRVLRSARDDLALEGLSKQSFAVQKSNRWRLQGKSLYDIFGEVVGTDEYPFVYGILSESIHGSWNESMDWCLSRNDDGTFSAFALTHGVDARVILPLVRYATPPFVLWSDRIQLQNDSMRQTFDRIHDYSLSIYLKFDELYDGPPADGSTLPDPEVGDAALDRGTHKRTTMDEIQNILAKYDRAYLKRLFASTPEADQLALTFFEDVTEILDTISRLKNVERNPTGFSIDDAPILGLLVRTWKLLKLIVWIYKEDSAEYAVIAERSLIEEAVIATYLLRADKSTMEDYRRCSYRHRFRMLEQAASGSEYYHSKAGQRLLRSINEKLALEGLVGHSFEQQIQNHWRVQGKTFHAIFKEVVGEDLYAVAYGTFSESVHGSWQDVRSFSLRGNVARGFSPLYEPLRESVGHVSLIVPFATLPFRGWATRVQLDDPYIEEVLDFVDKLNGRLFEKYGRLFHGF